MAEPTNEWKPANESDSQLYNTETVNHSYEENEEAIDAFKLNEKPFKNGNRIETVFKSNPSLKVSPFFNQTIPG
jgi:hypothetical protein